MKIKIQRMAYTDYSTIGRLYIDDEFICYTLENTCRQNIDKSQKLMFDNSHIKARDHGIYKINGLVYCKDSDIIGFFDLNQFEHITFSVAECVSQIFGFIALGTIFSSYSVYGSEKAFLRFISKLCVVEDKDNIEIEIENL